MARELRLQVVLRALRDTRTELQGLNRAQQQVGQFRELRQGLEGARTALVHAAERTQALALQLSSTANPTRALHRTFDQARQQLHMLEQQEQRQAQQLQHLSQGLRGAGIDTRQLTSDERQLGQAVQRTTQRLEAQRTEFKQLGKEQRTVAQARARLEASRSTAGGASGQGGVSGAKVLSVGARLFKPGLDFEASQSRLQAVTGLDKDSESMKGFRNQARHRGLTTSFSAADVSDLQTYLYSAGHGAEAIEEMVPGVLNLTRIGGSALMETAHITSSLLKVFELHTSQTDAVSDVLANTLIRSNTDLLTLMKTLKSVAPQAVSLGLGIETTAAMAHSLNSALIQDGAASTALGSILSRFANPPLEAQDTFKTLSITTHDANGNLRDMVTLLAEINQKTLTLGDRQQTAALQAIAGQDNYKALSVLVQEADTGELQGLVSQLHDSQGDAANMAHVMAENLHGDLTGLGRAWEDFGIQLQEQENGPLRSLTQTVTTLVTNMKLWVAEHPALTSSLLKAAAGVAVLMTVMGGLTLAMATLLGPFAVVRVGMNVLGIGSLGLISGLKALGGPVLTALATGLRVVGTALWGLAANPAALAIGLMVGALAVGAYQLYRHWDKAKPFFADVWNHVSTAFSGGILSIMELLADFSPVGLLYRGFSSALNLLGLSLPTRFSELGGLLMGGLADGLRSAMTAVTDTVTSLGENLIGTFKNVLGIHSPSRVFSELGGFAMAGLNQGLVDSGGQPLRTVADLGQRLANAGQFDLSASIRGTATAIDTRPPLGAAAALPATGSSTFNITIHGAPGMDPHALARAVAAELDRREQATAVRRRSALYDQD
jgi:TP901 family phage tail tape measure protein